MAVSDSSVFLVVDTALCTYVRWTEKKANHFIWYSREKENVIFWTNDSKRWIFNIWQSQEYYWVRAVLRCPNFTTGHPWHLLSFLLKSKPNWGQADVRRKGKKVYITVYMILGEKKWEGRRYISYKKKTNRTNYVTSGHISQCIWK